MNRSKVLAYFILSRVWFHLLTGSYNRDGMKLVDSMKAELWGTMSLAEKDMVNDLVHWQNNYSVWPETLRQAASEEVTCLAL